MRLPSMRSQCVSMLTASYVGTVWVLGFMVFTSGSSMAQDIVGPSSVSVPGLSDYQIASCCRKRCNGKCCYCGGVSGFMSNCVTECGIGIAELRRMAPLRFENPLNVRGRLVHVLKRTPLPNERVSLTLPGGKVLTTTTGGDGRFSLLIGEGKSVPVQVSMGDVGSVPLAEREVGEEPVYQLFLTKTK
jgi:hypothetical protein